MSLQQCQHGHTELRGQRAGCGAEGGWGAGSGRGVRVNAVGGDVRDGRCVV